jgi:hypothetical protein
MAKPWSEKMDVLLMVMMSCTVGILVQNKSATKLGLLRAGLGLTAQVEVHAEFSFLIAP